jgi:hypothetical protein
MADMQPRDYLVGILLFTLFITGGVTLIDMFYAQDSNFVDPDKYEAFNQTFNVKNDVDEAVSDIRDSIVTQNLPAPVAFIATMFLTAFQALMALFTSLGFMTAVFNGLYYVFGIPLWVSSILISLVTIMIVFSIISAILQRDI